MVKVLPSCYVYVVISCLNFFGYNVNCGKVEILSGIDLLIMLQIIRFSQYPSPLPVKALYQLIKFIVALHSEQLEPLPRLSPLLRCELYCFVLIFVLVFHNVFLVLHQTIQQPIQLEIGYFCL